MESKSKKTPIRYAVVGLGHIAQTAVLPAFRHASRDAKLVALVSGDELKLRRLGKRYGVTNLFRYEEYDDLLQSELIDAVYIALPNHLHAEYALRALRRGVHVLCEKPLALTEADCRRLAHASAKSGKLLMTAYRLHFEQANLKAIEAREKIGEPRYFTSNFSYQLRDRKNIRLEAEEGGNPMWDLGVYCINAARYLFRDEPVEVSAMAATSNDPRFREIDEMVTVTMKFPGERLASFTCSFGAADEAFYELVGTRGSLCMEGAYEYAMKRHLTVAVGDNERKLEYRKTDQFAPELVYFSRCIREGRKVEASAYEGWADVRVILAAEKSLRKGKAVRLGKVPAELAGKVRPTLRQWIERPPVRKPPEPIHARAAGG